jgi:hypothetical protein
MKPPLVGRAARPVLLADLAQARQANCQWPRLGGSRRRPCGRCIRCDADGLVDRFGAALH